MDIKQIRALVAIVETGSVTRAAEVLHVVQPAVSRQIKLLEEELGAPLFRRERHGMELTEAGQIMLDHGRRVIRELDLATALISRRRDAISGDLTIGFLPTASDFLASALMGRVRETYPGIRLRSSVSYIDDIEMALTRGQIDLALLYEREERAGFPTEPLIEEELFIVGPAAAGLRIDTPISFRALRDWPMVLPPRPNGLRLMAEGAWLRAGISLERVTEAGSIAMQKALVAKDVGITVLPGLCLVDELRAGTLSAAPVSDADFTRRIVLAVAPDRPASTASEAVMQVLRVILRERIAEQGWPGARWIGDLAHNEN